MAQYKEKYYKNSKKWREHEKEMALLHAFSADPELKYYLGVAGGVGVAWLGGIIGYVDGSETNSNSDTAKSAALGWLALGPAGALLAATWNEESKENPLGSLIQLSGVSFAGFCAAVLILKAMSGGSEGKGMLQSLVGAVV